MRDLLVRGLYFFFLSGFSSQTLTIHMIHNACVYQNATRWHLIELPFEWLIDNAMFVCLLDEWILDFC